MDRKYIYMISSWQSGANPPILWRPPHPPPDLCCLLLLFQIFVPVTSCAILHNHNMDLHMLRLGSVGQKNFDVCFMQQDARFTEVWHNVVFYWYSNLIPQTQNIHSTLRGHTESPIFTHIYLHQLLCAHNSYLYYIKRLMNSQVTDIKTNNTDRNNAFSL